ncbi:MAG: acetate--CoA ligase family protein, partial [Burkholderiales bacterium]
PAIAREMIVEIKGYPVLAGARGKPPADVEALVDTLVKLSALAMDLKDRVGELDINPLIIRPKGQGVTAADALISIKG